MEKLNSKWQKLIVWVTGYLNIIAFFIGGGYTYLKTTDENVKKSAKTAFLLVVGFAALEIIRGIFSNIFSIREAWDANAVMSDIANALSIIKAILFATLCVLDLFDIQIIPVDKIFAEKEKKEETEEDTPTEEVDEVEEAEVTEE